ncbi:hypothetical protein BLX87_13245 [Bacillus sp. VT-16-64]|nr:hypothetical protein BLX87_13245 [Bacillus sp. VT-16-64]
MSSISSKARFFRVDKISKILRQRPSARGLIAKTFRHTGCAGASQWCRGEIRQHRHRKRKSVSIVLELSNKILSILVFVLLLISKIIFTDKKFYFIAIS